MAEIIREITIDVAKANVFQAIVAKQFDSNSRFLKATITNDGEPLTIPSSASITINALREDGNAEAFLGSVNDDGTITVPLSNWMLQLDGIVKCDISIVTADSKLTTTMFSLAVEEAAYGGSDISDDPNYDLLIQLLEDCSAIKEDCANATSAANEAASAATNAAESANSAASDANAASSAANKAAMSANSATERANAAAAQAVPDQTYSPKSENAQSGKAVAEAIVNKPTLYTGTEYSNSDPHMLGKLFSSSTALPYKNGDFYYNTDERILYTFTNVLSSTEAMFTSFFLKPLTIDAEINYDPESLFAQSGFAVAEAVSSKADKLPELTELILGDDTPTGYFILKKSATENYVEKYYSDGSTQNAKYSIAWDKDTLIEIYRTRVSGDGSYEIHVHNLEGCHKYVKKATSDSGLTHTGTTTYISYASKASVEEAITKANAYTDTKIGDIDTALDSIIALQNSYIGGNA